MMKSSNQGFNSHFMGRRNVETILKLIRSIGHISRTEIAKITGLSKPAISSSVNRLLEKNLILEEVQENYSQVGRKPRSLTLNPEGAYFLTIDVGGTKVRIGLTNLASQIVAMDSGGTPEDWDHLSQFIVQKVKHVEQWSRMDITKINALVIAVPGVVKPDGSVEFAPNIKGLNKVRVKEQLEREISIPIFVENDVNIAALGEYYERGEKHSSLVYVAIGTGVGSGIVINGDLYRGSANHAGEVGWLINDENQLTISRSDTKGCLENRISGPALFKRGKNFIQQNDDTPTIVTQVNTDKMNPEAIFRSFERGGVGHNLIESWVKQTALLVCNISLILDPELVVLGGGVMKTGSKFLDWIRDLVHRHTQHPPEIELPKRLGKESFYGGTALCHSNINELVLN